MKLKTILLKTLYALFFVVAGTVNLHAQHILVSGSLSDENNKPVEYASVRLLQAKDSSIVKGALSNGAGIYSFGNIMPGDYIIKVTNTGYIDAFSKPLHLVAGAASFIVPVINIQVNSHNLHTVNISANKPLIERKTDRIVMNVANSVLSAGNSALEILEKAPGVNLDKDDNIILNGKRGVTVMINDKLTYLSEQQLASLLRSTDGNTIQSIEVITSPSAKYDAAGNSGIINIKLKKTKQSGTNVSLTLGTGVGQYFRDNGGVSINHKEGKLNVFASYNRSDNKRSRDIFIDRIIKQKNGDTALFNQHTALVLQDHNNSYRAGAEYDITSKNTVGFMVSGYSNRANENNNDRTIIGSGTGVIDSSLLNTTGVTQSYRNLAVNVNDKFKIDTAGQELSIDVDYSKFNNDSYARYNNDFFSADGSQQHPQQVLINQTPSNIDIRAAKADYVLPLSKTLKLETGVKYSSVKSDNDLNAQILDNGSFVNDPTRTNHFIYTEKIGAGYVNLNKSWSETSVQLGLRSEYTHSNGDLIGGDPVTRHYLDFFPNVFVNQVLDDKNEISFSFSRRIERPGYSDLNPFVYYLDPFTFSQGNAHLNPEYTNGFEVNYTLNKKINIGLSYTHTTDAITALILTTGNQSVESQLNLKSKDYYSVNFNTPFTITKWWTANVNATVYYQKFLSDSIAGSTLNNARVSYIAKATQTFVFGKFKGEILGNYTSSRVYAAAVDRSLYYVDAGLSRSFANNKANLKFAVSDIFNTRKFVFGSQLLNNNYVFTSKSDSRIARLTFTYNFGNSKIKARKHTAGLADEADRVKKND